MKRQKSGLALIAFSLFLSVLAPLVASAQGLASAQDVLQVNGNQTGGDPNLVGTDGKCNCTALPIALVGAHKRNELHPSNGSGNPSESSK
jgi:hypothetical protein